MNPSIMNFPLTLCLALAFLMRSSHAQQECVPVAWLKCMETNCQQCTFALRRNLGSGTDLLRSNQGAKLQEEEDDYCSIILSTLGFDMEGSCECCPECGNEITDFYNDCFLEPMGCHVEGCPAEGSDTEQEISAALEDPDALLGDEGASGAGTRGGLLRISSLILVGLGVVILA